MSRIGTFRAALVVAAKELRSAFRDRQTRTYTLLMPLVMYPAMFWIALQASALVRGLESARAVRVEVVAGAGADARAHSVVEALEQGRDPSTDPTEYRLGDGSSGAVARGDGPDARVRVPGDGPLEVEYDASRTGSILASERVAARLGDAVETRREERLGAPVAALAPWEFERRDVAAPEQLGAFVVSVMLPLMLIAMATMGAFFPAVDVTAGEKERRTQETTLLAPVPRAAIFGGQIASVAVASAAATAMNLVGMTIAANHLLGMLSSDVSFSLPISKVLMLAPLVFATVLFLAAALTAMASFTDTFKQGQSLLGAVQTLFILPAMASTLPGIELTYGLAAVPIVGTSVAMRDVVRADSLSDLALGPMLVSILSMALLGAVATALAVRAMQRERTTAPRWVLKLTGRAGKAGKS
ncbi:MAG: ABC transporter permease subunit [Planctomycetota bacterium]